MRWSSRTSRSRTTALATVTVAVLAHRARGCARLGQQRRRRARHAGLHAPGRRDAEELGEGEGAVNILAWPGYAEDGSTDKAVDWVTPFEKETGCKATVKYFGTSDEAVSLMKGGQYDVVVRLGRRHPAADRLR